jgi:hypothetical protein
MKTLYALPVVLAASFVMSGAASAQGGGGFSYQKQWWPQAVITRDGRSLGSGEAYEYAGPSGPDLWNDPRAWWNDYNQGSVVPYASRPSHSHRNH